MNRADWTFEPAPPSTITASYLHIDGFPVYAEPYAFKFADDGIEMRFRFFHVGHATHVRRIDVTAMGVTKNEDIGHDVTLPDGDVLEIVYLMRY